MTLKQPTVPPNHYRPQRIAPMLAAVCLALVPAVLAQGKVVVDFEDLALASDSHVAADGSDTDFASRSVSFNTDWNDTYDCCPSAWAYSNRRDLTTAGHTNSFSAYAGSGGGGANGSKNFAIANNNFLGEAVVTLPKATTVEGAFFTNTTYAYLAVKNGDDGNATPFVKGPFEAGDWFRLEIVGLDAAGKTTGSVDFDLADFTNGNSTIIDDWTWVDLSGLGDQVTKLHFKLSSSDSHTTFGMNTPAYFAMDDLTVTSVPEPSAGLLLLTGTLAIAFGRRTRFGCHECGDVEWMPNDLSEQ